MEYISSGEFLRHLCQGLTDTIKYLETLGITVLELTKQCTVVNVSVIRVHSYIHSNSITAFTNWPRFVSNRLRRSTLRSRPTNRSPETSIPRRHVCGDYNATIYIYLYNIQTEEYILKLRQTFWWTVPATERYPTSDL